MCIRDRVQSDDTAGNTGRSSGSNRQRSQTESGRPDRTASSAESGTGQNGRRTGMDTSYESDQSAGRGADNSGGYLQLSLFQTEEEQIEEIRKAAAEVEQPAAFFITDEVVDDVLRTGSGKDNTLSYITAKLVEDLEHDELRQYLVLHYGTGGKGFDFSGQKISVWYDQDGLRFRRGESARKNFDRMVTWEEATERIQDVYKRQSLDCLQQKISNPYPVMFFWKLMKLSSRRQPMKTEELLSLQTCQ